ncbi:tRNA threonylcarbamoyladenosine biosynthesis protein TsaB [Rhizomicrobium palustre]|uniref:tRNA threonylcarbamoyladenosine biosynthesis protein TsaB n=1 Tax=Rhizomicrobium palustre TaxID=189966 RepID=A0A846MY09_9PROT|nr:tRNA (adenosine(37)-N6)-threonylcarbamoyltransferase complex dimerization subunit type 1 TsaB [Rhizomicrobium palustre]NIK88129.1 tRNA threonylcarbamoyladenosine biosynthesis protein TsaB [Rhizomicrobium palustre]
MSEPLILAADTCFGACSAALLRGQNVVARQNVAMERGHAEALAPMVEAVMREAGLSFSEIDRLAVTTGPGSFTGQRVGLAFMRGLRVALAKPLHGITSLAAMAEQARVENNLMLGAAVHDAKRGEVYLALQGSDFPPALLSLADAAEILAPLGPMALAGTAAPRFAREGDTLTTITAPDATWVARLAQLQVTPTIAPRPLYLRAPDAKLPGGLPGPLCGVLKPT